MRNDHLRSLAVLVGWSALVFSALYWLSDWLEVAGGGFSNGQLYLTLVAEAAIPPVVLGLWWLQRRQLGRLGAVSAWAYAWAYVFFTFTVIYALVEGPPDFSALSEDLGASMVLHGAVMLLAGITLGTAIARAGVLPPWTGWALAAGVVAVVATQGASSGVELASSAIRDVAFAGMGVHLIRRQSEFSLSQARSAAPGQARSDTSSTIRGW